MKLIYMGTPDIAVPALNALHEGGHEILAAVTQPDRPKGRGKALGEPPVKTAARALGIPVLQPERVKKNEELLETLKELSPDVIVVMAFGQILPGEILTLPRYGCVNIHASLLPRYRGAAPIQWAVIDGEKETGLTTMYMSEGLDTGDMLLKTVVPIDKDETGGSLHDKLAKAAGPLILKTLEGLEEGTITPVPQEGESSYASMLTKEMGHIDWTKDAADQGAFPLARRLYGSGRENLKALADRGFVPSGKRRGAGDCDGLRKGRAFCPDGKRRPCHQGASAFRKKADGRGGLSPGLFREGGGASGIRGGITDALFLLLLRPHMDPASHRRGDLHDRLRPCKDHVQ